MTSELSVDADALRREVRSKYREVAVNPHGTFHFHTGRPLARRLGYDETVVVKTRPTVTPTQNRRMLLNISVNSALQRGHASR